MKYPELYRRIAIRDSDLFLLINQQIPLSGFINTLNNVEEYLQKEKDFTTLLGSLKHTVIGEVINYFYFCK